MTRAVPEQLPERPASEPRENRSERGQLYFLWHPNTTDTFSGYGLALWSGRKDLLTGLLMVDRPQPVDLNWLKEVENTFGEYALRPMTATGERGIVCQMWIEPESLLYVQRLTTEKSAPLQQALHPLLENPPEPAFRLRWDEGQRLWTSTIIRPFDLPPELREVFERTGPGCVATETNLGVVHVCHATDENIAGFANRAAVYQWQLALLPTAPVLRLRLSILDQPLNPYRFESFLNVGRDDDARMLNILLDQESLYLAFYGDNYHHHYTKVLDHATSQREQLRQLAVRAVAYLRQLPVPQRDFDLAKAEFQRETPL